MKKKRVLTAAFISALLVSALAGSLLVYSAKANGYIPTYAPEITINSDGSITPETNLINRTGNVYTLTANVDGYAIRIRRSNIVFDGAGYTINTTNGDNPGLHLTDVNSVTVKNIEVFGSYTSIYLYYSSNCLLTNVKTNNSIYLTDGSNSNTITESTVRYLIEEGDNNLIVKNSVRGLWVYGSNNRLYKNNFFLEDFPGVSHDNFWDNGSIGNYWGNYSIKYPNASEIGNTGIGDTPYIIERESITTRWYPKAKNVDNYPLMYPWGAPEIALLGMQNATYSGSYLLNFTVSKPAMWMGYSLDGQDNVTITGNVTLGELSNGLHNITVYANDTFGNMGTSETISFTIAKEPETFPTTIVIAPIASVAVIGVGLLVYFKKRKR